MIGSISQVTKTIPYVTRSIRKVELKRSMLDPGSLVSIISLSVLDAIGVPDNIKGQPIEVSGFGDNSLYILGFVNLDLTRGLINA